MTSVLARYATRVAAALGAVAVASYPLRLITGEPLWATTGIYALGGAAVVLLVARTTRVESAVKRYVEEVTSTGQHKKED